MMKPEDFPETGLLEALHVGHVSLPAQRIDARGCTTTTEWVAEELPVALCYNDVSHAVMMASPGDLEDFAIGFSLSEGIVEHAAEITDITQHVSPQGITLALRITERRMTALRERRRALTGRTGCGLCGAESLEQAIRPVTHVTADFVATPAMIREGFAELARQQVLNHATGAAHAAALFDGQHSLVREDIGRHNALDKLIGAMQRSDLNTGILLVTSRASYEMVHKAASANIGLLAAISAPTLLAIELAQTASITLVGFARGESLTCYTQGRVRLLS
ncbi:formate dehydrogenase accessory sulfurtransferase FdhD [Uliginosibacterium sp. H3]|uniref:Sulfur carrier protein FdhD n=1 Tax=Uliginosibacterium silvisoli TaxID=3114758 RepID=A0ABU6JZG0_9RHOO|nr:formate dehydrogenase accessory sulfurtransferase FdhD [Uliginosibacterium sp. H3]